MLFPHLKSSWWVSGYHPYLVVLLLFSSWFNNTAADSALFIKQDGSPERKMPWFSSFASGGNLLIFQEKNTSCKSHPPSSICSSLLFETSLKKDSTLKKNTYANIMKYGSIRHMGRKGQEILHFACLFQVYIKQIMPDIMDQRLYVSTLGR